MESAVNLTRKQKRFCEEYIFDFNAARAARLAGYSEDSIYAIASENLRKPDIQAYIKELEADLAKTSGISRLMVIQEFKKLAFSSIAHLHKTWVERKEFDKLTDDQKACIQEISTQTRMEKNPIEGGDPIQVDFVKVKLYDKGRALESINKMLGYNAPDKIENVNPKKQVIKIGDTTIEF
jgi:phage terminase small subunit